MSGTTSVTTLLRTTLVAALTAGVLCLLPGAASEADPQTGGSADATAAVPAGPTGSYVALVSRGRRASYGVDTRSQTLEVVSPTGARRVVWSAPVNPHGRGYLTLSDVAADGTTALLTTTVGPHNSRTRALGVDLASGAVRAVDVGRRFVVEQLAPDGSGVLLGRYSGRQLRLAALTWGGVLRQGDVALGGRLLSLDPTTVLSTTAGRETESVDAVSTATGTVVRRYPTPGLTCSPVRRWDASQALLSCWGGRTTQVVRLLDTATGVLSAPTGAESSAVRAAAPFDARALGGSVFLQVAGRCGFSVVRRALPDGTVAPVAVPGARGQVTLLGTSGSSLVVQTGGACRGAAPRQTLTLVDPATGAARPLLVLPGKEVFERVVPLGEQQASQL